MADEPSASVPDNDPTPPAEPKFTPPQSQDEFDSMIGQRLKRERESAIKAERERFADYDDLKSKAQRFDELEAEKLSEVEKERAAREQAEKDRDTALQRANGRLIEAAVLAAATTQRALKPEHLHRLIDLTDVTVADDGQVTGAQEAVAAFLEANPEYVGGRSNGSADQGARGGGKQITREQLSTMTREERLKAHDEGRLDHLMTGQ